MKQESVNEEKYIGYIYKATCILNDKCYIGETTRSFNRRKVEHLSAAKSTVHKGKNYHFYRAIRKYGEENFNWEIIQTCTNIDKKLLYKELFKLEQCYIKEFNSFHNGYNLTLGGGGVMGRIVTDEEREKARKRRLGVKMSEETKELLRQQRINIPLSKEHKSKIKIATKIACENNPERSKKIKEKLQVGVKVFTEDGKLVNTFNCIKEGANFYNTDPSYVTKNCKRIAQTSGKFNNLRLIWRYIEDDFTIDDKKNLKPVIIEIFTENNIFIETLNCAKDLCTKYNLQSSSVSQVLSGKRQHCIIPEIGKIKIKYKNMFNYE